MVNHIFLVFSHGINKCIKRAVKPRNTIKDTVHSYEELTNAL